MQLNFFDHARDTMLRNDVVAAFERGDAAAARDAMQVWQAEFPDDPLLPDAHRLLPELGALSAGTPALDRAALAQQVERAEEQLAAAAKRLLGAGSHPWMHRWWRALADRSRQLDLDAAAPELHEAALRRRAEDWPAMADAAARIESWRRKPLPLEWMACARWHLDGRDAAWPLLAELAWLAPGRLPPLLSDLPDDTLHRLARRFEADLADEDAADSQHNGRAADTWALFPAWLLVEEPRLAAVLERAERRNANRAEQAFEAVASALRLERKGAHAELVAARARLRALDARLFACYMRTR